MNDFASLNLDLLAERCNEETLKYFRRQDNEPGYCFELLCRACRDRNQDALKHAYTTYIPQLKSRARHHPAFADTCQDEDAFARTALANYYFAVNGDRFLQMFPNLKRALGYLNDCLDSVVIHDRRKNKKYRPENPKIPSPSQDLDVDVEDLWLRLCRQLASRQDRRLAYSCFVLEMKVAEIAARYPQFWTSPRDVSVALQRIRRKLRKDPYFRDLADLTDDDTPETDD